MKLFHITWLILALALSAIMLASPAYALSTDRDQPAEIEADDIEFDFKKGIRTYNNNVLIVQGTLRLKADKLETIYKDDQLELATAWGSLARFKQRPDGKQDDVEGWARKIIVDQKKNLLTLVGKAALRQGADTARGETIIYNMATDTLRVTGGAKVGAAGKDGSTAPKRKLEDPFKDDSQGPPPIGSVKSKKKKGSKKSSKQAQEGDNADEEEIDDEEDEELADQSESESEVEPVRSGRSRLIIQPK